MNEEQLASMLEKFAQSRSTEIRDLLFEAFFPLAKSIAKRFTGRGVELEDLHQVAGMALVKALTRFEPERGYRFVTYAVPTIAGDVRNYVRDKGGAMRMPRDARQKLQRMRQEQERFSQTYFREPTAKELAVALEIAPEELLLLLSLREQSEVSSLDASAGDDGTEFSAFLGEREAGYDRAEDSEWMRWVYSKVNDVERELLRLRYQEQMGQRETAKHLGVSQMQVSRMERRILARLRAIEQSGA